MSADNLLSPRANALADQVTALRRELAAAQEARLAAELRAEGLWAWVAEQIAGLERSSLPEAARGALNAFEAVARQLAAPPPDLGPLRELLAADADLDAADSNETAAWAVDRWDRAREAVRSAYPFLDPGAEPAGEVP